MTTLVTLLERLDILENEVINFENPHYRVQLIQTIHATREYIVLNQGRIIKFFNEKNFN